jgi:hypothetical protein
MRCDFRALKNAHKILADRSKHLRQFYLAKNAATIFHLGRASVDDASSSQTTAVLMGLDGHYQVGTHVVVVGKRLRDYTGQTGTVIQILANPEGIDILDRYVVAINGREISFWANELRRDSQSTS